MSPTTSPSTRRLSEVARHVVAPSGIVSTGFPAVEAKLRQLGLGFDEWQRGAARLLLGKRQDGLYATTVGGAFMSLPRQVGKTYMVSAVVFALCLIFPGLTVLWTAHLLRTTGETHRAWKSLAKRKSIAPFVESIRSGSGDWEVRFTNGSRILLGAREGGFGRGFAEVDVIVFDEAQILTDKALDDMIPAANASRFPAGALVLYMGTPPKPGDESEVFSRARAAALSGEADDQLYIECSADADTNPEKWPPGFVDFDAIAAANPSYPTRTPRASILRMAKQLSRGSLRREGLGIWDDGPSVASLVSLAQWRELAGEPGSSGVTAYGIRFGGGAVALSVAFRDEVSVHVEGIEERPLAEGTGWLVEWLTVPAAEGLRPAWEGADAIVIDGKEGAGAFADDLQRAGAWRASVLDTQKAVTANAGFLDAIRNKTLTHGDQPGLNEQAARAAKRSIGTSGGWGWKSVDGESVRLFEAAALAHYGAMQAHLGATSTSGRRGFVG